MDRRFQPSERAHKHTFVVTPEDIAADLMQSLDHLGVDTIDLYFLHMDNPESPVEPIIDALIAHREAGRIRHFAASNWAADRITAANAYAASLGKPGDVRKMLFLTLRYALVER